MEDKMLPQALLLQLVSPDWRRNLNVQAFRCVLSALNLVLAGITLFLLQTDHRGSDVVRHENLLHTLLLGIDVSLT